MPRSNKSRRGNKQSSQGEGGGGWLQTFGDMMTLLLVFFVLLYSISTIDADKFERMLISIQDSFSGVLPEHEAQIPQEDPDMVLPDPKEEDIPTEEEEMMEDVHDQLAEYLEDEELADVVMMETEDRGIVIRFQDKILFDPGEADLKEEAYQILEDIADILEELPNEISIEGFTDDVPQNTPEFPSNWELSTGRATAVLRFITEEAGLDPERLRATGYGEYQPMVPNDSPENRQLNRRVDITVLWSTWGQDEYFDRDDDDLFERGEDEFEK